MIGAREQVMAQLVQLCRDANAAGRDGMSEIERCFPGTPIEVATEAWLTANGEDVEAWWQAIEKTIDGAVIKQALLAQAADVIDHSIEADAFLDGSITWAIHHLGEARRQLHARDHAAFHEAIRKFGACAKALLDTVPEVRT